MSRPPDLASSAQEALAAAGFETTIITGDGTQGYLDRAQCDRVISTASIRVGELPRCWMDQTKLGGLIVTPMRTDSGGAVALVRFTVGADGTALGQPVSRLGFIAIRNHRTPEWSIDGLDADDPAAEVSTTRLKPWRVVDSHDARWAIGTQVPSCVWEHQAPTDSGAEHVLWLIDPVGGSWAVARYDREPGPRQIRQHGPRRLWDEVVTAFRAWAAAAKPAVESTTLVITPSAQSIRLSPGPNPARQRLTGARPPSGAAQRSQ